MNLNSTTSFLEQPEKVPETLGVLSSAILNTQTNIIDYNILLNDLEKICNKIGFFNNDVIESPTEKPFDKLYHKAQNNNEELLKNNRRLYNCIALLKEYL